MFVAKEMVLTRGVGRHKEKLASFEMALRDASISEFNLVRVSSIFPPGCKIVSKEQGLKTLNPGQIVFAVIAEMATNEPNRLITSSIGVALPNEKTKYGYLSEHHSFGETAEKSGDYAEDLAAMLLASSLGIDIETQLSYDERKAIWSLKKEIVSTRNITQSAVGDKKGLWTTVIAASVLVPPMNQA